MAGRSCGWGSIVVDVKAVLVEVPATLVEERRRTGADRWDELWEGELHMVPPPSGPHQRLGMALAMVLNPLCCGSPKSRTVDHRNPAVDQRGLVGVM